MHTHTHVLTYARAHAPVQHTCVHVHPTANAACITCKYVYTHTPAALNLLKNTKITLVGENKLINPREDHTDTQASRNPITLHIHADR